MWILFILVLATVGLLALCDAPARARRHAEERGAVLRALAVLQGRGTADAVLRTVARVGGSPLAGQAVRAHLAALEEDGAVEARPAGGRPGSEPSYRLLVTVPEDATTMTGPSRLTVYHDGACPLCAAEIGQYRRARGGGAIAFVDVADPAATVAGDVSREAALARFHVRDARGELLSGAAAFVALWEALPGWRWLGRIVGTWPILPLAEAAYRAFLPLRPVIARTLVRRGVLSRPAAGP